MNFTQKFFILILLSFFSCFFPSKIKRDAYYLEVNPSISLLSSSNKNWEKINNVLQSNNLSKNYYEVIYKHEDINADKVHDYSIFLFFNEENFIIIRTDGNENIVNERHLDVDNKKVSNFIKGCKNIKPMAYKRDFMGTEDIRSSFLISENKRIYYYYESIGFHCVVPDTENRMQDSYDLIKMAYWFGMDN